VTSTRRILVALVVVAAGVSGALASEGGADGASLIKPNLGTLFWTLVTFAIFAFLLGKFAWKPLTGALDAREASIRESLDGAKNEREEAERVLAEHKQLVAGAHRERASTLATAQEDGEKLKAEILDEARKQREQILAKTDAQVQSGLRQAKAELRVEAVDLAIQAAGKLLDKNLDDAAQRQLVERHLADLERSAGSDAAPS
jgi:F-type H+-transporting ATPase subunit b